MKVQAQMDGKRKMRLNPRYLVFDLKVIVALM